MEIQLALNKQPCSAHAVSRRVDGIARLSKDLADSESKRDRLPAMSRCWPTVCALIYGFKV